MDDIAQETPLFFDDDFCRPPWGGRVRDFVLVSVAAISHTLPRLLNQTEFRNAEAIQDAVLRRGNRALVTYSNHVSTFDDPGVLASLMPLSFWAGESIHRRGRWSLCAREYCFGHPVLTHFFRHGKVVPVERGMGTQQPCVGAATRRVVDGDWVHIFAEGRVNYDGRVSQFRWGIGRVLCDAVEAEFTGQDVSTVASRHHAPVKPFPYPDGYWEAAMAAHARHRQEAAESASAGGGDSDASASDQPRFPAEPIGGCSDRAFPLVLPIFHTGMGDVMPAKARVPRVGNRVTVNVGEPVDVSDLLRKCACAGGSRPELWAQITARLHRRMVELEAQIPERNTDQTQLPWFPNKVRPRRRRLMEGDGDPPSMDREGDAQGRPMS